MGKPFKVNFKPQNGLWTCGFIYPPGRFFDVGGTRPSQSMNLQGADGAVRKYAQGIKSPFPGMVCQQSRQCVTSGPTTGNFWSTKLAPEQGMDGGGTCAIASGRTRQKTNARAEA